MVENKPAHCWDEKIKSWFTYCVSTIEVSSDKRGGRIVVRTLPRHRESKEMWVNEKENMMVKNKKKNYHGSWCE